MNAQGWPRVDFLPIELARHPLIEGMTFNVGFIRLVCVKSVKIQRQSTVAKFVVFLSFFSVGRSFQWKALLLPNRPNIIAERTIIRH